MKQLMKWAMVAALLSPMSVMAETKEGSVEQLLEVMQIEKQMMGGFEAMTPMINQLADNLQLNPAETQELVQIYREWFVEDVDRKKIIKEMAILYSETFNQEEINDMLAFYSTSAGQKSINEAPRLMQLGAQLGMQEAALAESKLIERLTPFLEKHQPQ